VPDDDPASQIKNGATTHTRQGKAEIQTRKFTDRDFGRFENFRELISASGQW